MGARTQPIPGYYVWEVPGKPVVVHLHLDVIDRLLSEAIRGAGTELARPAEVGGVLTGTIQHGDPSIVRVEDFQSVPCDHMRGPAYIFTDDMDRFEDACRHWRPEESRSNYAVGYFRSHTSDGLSLATDDILLLDRFLPSPWHIALLVRPFGAKVTAGFFFREDGKFQKSTPLEFPFRRTELGGGESPAETSNGGNGRRRDSETVVPDVVAEDDDSGDAPDVRTKTRLRGGRVWIPLSFIFLFLGVLLGFQAALTMAPKVSEVGGQDLSLGISVAQAGENLNVKWDRQAAPVRSAQRGLLEIEDGALAKSVDLDVAQLQNGSLIYRNSSNAVRFRLTVYPKARLTVTETVEWRK
jgi:hypothetical protein